MSEGIFDCDALLRVEGERLGQEVDGSGRGILRGTQPICDAVVATIKTHREMGGKGALLAEGQGAKVVS